MFSKTWTSKSTGDYWQKIERLKAEIQGADAVLIGAGAGLSTSAGLTYSGERFLKYFADFHEKYGMDDNKASKIHLSLPGVDISKETDWPRMTKFHADVSKRLYTAFKEPSQLGDLRRFFKQNYSKHEIYDSQKEYRKNMLSRWNVHNEQVLRMMKKAVSFRPIVDIQKFITENICDIPDKPDIEAMQQNIRDYKRHEQLAQHQEEKLAALQEIGKLYREMNQAIDRWRVQSFLVLWSEKEDKQSLIDQHELEKQDCLAELSAAEEEIENLANLIKQKEDRRRELDLACAQSSVFQEEEKLRSRKETLLSEYGFIFRYPGNKTDITGGAEEVWHYRYVGVEAATEMYEKGLCLEEYLAERQAEQ